VSRSPKKSSIASASLVAALLALEDSYVVVVEAEGVGSWDESAGAGVAWKNVPLGIVSCPCLFGERFVCGEDVEAQGRGKDAGI
jgi:hypothetical protein